MYISKTFSNFIKMCDNYCLLILDIPIMKVLSGARSCTQA